MNHIQLICRAANRPQAAEPASTRGTAEMPGARPQLQAANQSEHHRLQQGSYAGTNGFIDTSRSGLQSHASIGSQAPSQVTGTQAVNSRASAGGITSKPTPLQGGALPAHQSLEDGEVSGDPDARAWAGVRCPESW